MTRSAGYTQAASPYPTMTASSMNHSMTQSTMNHHLSSSTYEYYNMTSSIANHNMSISHNSVVSASSSIPRMTYFGSSTMNTVSSNPKTTTTPMTPSLVESGSGSVYHNTSMTVSESSESTSMSHTVSHNTTDEITRDHSSSQVSNSNHMGLPSVVTHTSTFETVVYSVVPDVKTSTVYRVVTVTSHDIVYLTTVTEVFTTTEADYVTMTATKDETVYVTETVYPEYSPSHSSQRTTNNMVTTIVSASTITVTTDEIVTITDVIDTTIYRTTTVMSTPVETGKLPNAVPKIFTTTITVTDNVEITTEYTETVEVTRESTVYYTTTLLLGGSQNEAMSSMEATAIYSGPAMLTLTETEEITATAYASVVTTTIGSAPTFANYHNTTNISVNRPQSHSNSSTSGVTSNNTTNVGHENLTNNSGFPISHGVSTNGTKNSDTGTALDGVNMTTIQKTDGVLNGKARKAVDINVDSVANAASNVRSSLRFVLSVLLFHLLF